MRLAGAAGGIGWSWIGIEERQIRLQNLGKFLNRNPPPSERIDDVARSLVVTSGAKHGSNEGIGGVEFRFWQSEKLCLRTVSFTQGIKGEVQFCIHGWMLVVLAGCGCRDWRTL